MNILFVCTGNTCRSPMAKCLCELIVNERELNVNCDSAGIFAMEGAPCSEYSALVMRKRGISLDKHRSKPVTNTLAAKADMIVCMTKEHSLILCQRFPSIAEKVITLSEDVSDPFGGSEESYEKTAVQLEKLLRKWEELN